MYRFISYLLIKAEELVTFTWYFLAFIVQSELDYCFHLLQGSELQFCSFTARFTVLDRWYSLELAGSVDI